MLGKTLQDAMNEQIKNELYSAYLYLSMAAYAESTNLPGFAQWMTMQSGEEVTHAMKFYTYINDRGGRVELLAIDQPPVDFDGPTDLFAKTLEHEKLVTALIHKLYAQAVEDNDPASQIFLQWFVTEQIEEEKSASDVLELLKRTGDRGQALVMVDRQLAQRQARGGEE